MPVFEAHGDSVVEPLAAVQRALDPAAEASSADLAARLLEVIRGMATTLEIPRFSQLDVPREDYGRLAELAVQNGSNESNPRTMRAEDYLQILLHAGR